MKKSVVFDVQYIPDTSPQSSPKRQREKRYKMEWISRRRGREETMMMVAVVAVVVVAEVLGC